MVRDISVLIGVLGILGSCADSEEHTGTSAQAEEAAAATVSSDKADYSPGETALLAGVGWAANEDVVLSIACTCGCNDQLRATTDVAGTFADAAYPIQEEHLGATCNVTAVGQSSGLVAQTVFTDGNVRSVTGAGTSYDVTYALYPTTTCTGTVVVQGNQAKQGTETVTSTQPSTIAVAPGQSVKLTAAASSAEGGAFTGWSGPNLNTSASTICIVGFTGTQQSYTASYGAAPPSNRPPVVTCANVANTTAPNSCSLNASVIASKSDPDGDAVTCTESPAAPYALGTTSVTVSCSDGKGGTASCTGTVTLTDDDAPAVTCGAPQTVECTSPQGASATLSASASDNCSGAVSASCPASGSMFPIGTTNSQCTARDTSGNTGSCTSSVTVVDTTAPSIACPAPVTAECTGHSAATVDVAAASASDVCGAANVSGPAPASYPLGVTALQQTATDAAGNTSSCSSTVTVVDTQAPSISCPAPVTVECTGNSSATVDVAAPVASDVCGGTSVSDPAAQAYPLGTTTVAETATDDVGLSASCTTTVTVADTTPPTIACPAAVTVECTANGQATVDVAAATAADQCGDASVTDPAAQSYPLGTSSVTQTATDASGLTASCSSTVTVVDTTPPTFTALAAQTLVGDCSGAPLAFAKPTAVDGCDTATVTCDALAGNRFGTNTITCTATDPSGNTATTQISVTVLQPLQVKFASPLADDNVADDIANDADIANVFQVKSTIPHQVSLYSCSGADVTTSVPVTVKITVTLRDGAAAQGDTNIVPTATGVGDSGGVMALVDGKYKYNLKTTGYQTGTSTSSLYFDSVVRVSYTSAPSLTAGVEDVRLESK